MTKIKNFFSSIKNKIVNFFTSSKSSSEKKPEGVFSIIMKKTAEAIKRNAKAAVACSIVVGTLFAAVTGSIATGAIVAGTTLAVAATAEAVRVTQIVSVATVFDGRPVKGLAMAMVSTATSLAVEIKYLGYLMGILTGAGIGIWGAVGITLGANVVGGYIGNKFFSTPRTIKAKKPATDVEVEAAAYA